MTRRLLVRVLGWTVSAACLAFFVAQARHAFSGSATGIDWTLAWRPVAVAMLPYMLAYVALAVAWDCLLRALGLHPSLRLAIGVYFSTQIAKYLPGNVGQHVGRVYLSAKHGLPPFRVGLSLAVEMGLIVAVAATLSIPLAPMLLERMGGRMAASIPAVMALACLGTGLALYLLRRHPLVISIRKHLALAVQEARAHGSLRFVPTAVLLVTLALALVGGSLLLLAGEATALQPDSIVQAVALVSASWIAGFLTPGAPAGLGVREAILLVGLGTLVSRQDALEATLLFRALSTVADLLAFAIGALLLRSAGPATRSAPGVLP